MTWTHVLMATIGAMAVALGIWSALDPMPSKVRYRAIEAILTITILWLLHGIIRRYHP